ncbi:WXG100 family type VII secretion target [Gandjariella thermophila]|uniref:PPE family domain-containing protein n=1 Tax=Gandjariella thermophila TaxID=1931992 RepID=A0A4D4J7V4_9PSEU|nr:rhs protein [Gandjariella thermophila]GDY32865.1 hypothetical protein GTS_44980 [Gandjariella thermophila]
MSNDLIAQPEPVSPTAGAGIVDSGKSLYDDIAGGIDKGEWDALALGVDGAAVGLDMLGMVLDPLGELVKAGVGWLMEHVEFIREPLEVLTGDPAQIEALSKTWTNIGNELNQAGAQYTEALRTVSGWKGDAAVAYRGVANDYAGGLHGVAEHVDHAAQGIAVAGMVVATERAIVFDMIASFISRVITEALIAAASSVVTLGGSVATFIASVTADAAILAGRLGQRLAKLLKLIEQFVRRFRSLGTKSREVANAIQHRANKIRRQSRKLVHDGTRDKEALQPDSGWGKRYHDYTGRMGESAAAKFNENWGTKIVKEGAKSVNQYDEEATNQQQRQP